MIFRFAKTPVLRSFISFKLPFPTPRSSTVARQRGHINHRRHLKILSGSSESLLSNVIVSSHLAGASSPLPPLRLQKELPIKPQHHTHPSSSWRNQRSSTPLAPTLLTIQQPRTAVTPSLLPSRNHLTHPPTRPHRTKPPTWQPTSHSRTRSSAVPTLAIKI